MFKFKPVDSKPNFPKLEEKILRFWKENDTLSKYLSKNQASKKCFSFLDGPITANNPMGVHHAWGRTLKDLYQRYKNMRGFAERFQNGFDNQGLWVEVEVEKKLGFKSKKDIEKFGIDKFVEECKKHTLHFAKVQTEQSKRLGYFMDWGNDYYTMSDENNYAIWHFLKKVWQDGNLYKGRDSVPWCPRCGTAISQHEILTEEYQEITHTAITVEYRLLDTENEYLLVWTTTPWTLPANVAIAVNPELDYVRFKTETGTFYSTEGYMKQTAPNATEVKKIKGAELVGRKYRSWFDHLPTVKESLSQKPNYKYQVIPWKDVAGEEGTGLVHIAPGAGAEDFVLGLEFDLPVIGPLDDAGVYQEGYGDFSGKISSEVSRLAIEYFEEKDGAWMVESYTHRYPVCWRCKTELVWRVVDEWYIAMDAARRPGAKNYRQQLQEVIKDVRWIPEFGYDRELDWLRNMEDWLISKKRYWGLALPIWECQKCGHFEVIGSKEELQEKAVEGWKDFEGYAPHRPWVDAVRIRCAECGEPMSRIPDVGNPWLDAGIVSFSTLKYFEDKDYWRKWFPADLVLESFPGQFKNWFYSLLAMSVVLEDTAPFKTLVGHALVRDEYGEEMHKSKGNAIEFNEAAKEMGADVMRWLYARHNIKRNLNFGYGPAEEIKRSFFLILWNCYKFFVEHASVDEWEPVAATHASLEGGRASGSQLHILDRWILSRLNHLIRTITDSLDNYDASTATRAIEDFVVSDFSTWYIRRSRDRVGPTAQDGSDKLVCYQTLHQVLLTLTKLLAPFVPFLAEKVYRSLALSRVRPSGGSDPVQSVHLEDWPEITDSLVDEELENWMDLTRQICEKGHAARKGAGIKVRQPLQKFKVQSSKFKVGNEELINLIKDELNVKEVEFVEAQGDLEVELDTTLTPELEAEGEARELVRKIQDLRKKVGCKLDDKITVEAPSWPKGFEDYIKSKTLAATLRVGPELKIVK